MIAGGRGLSREAARQRNFNVPSESSRATSVRAHPSVASPTDNSVYRGDFPHGSDSLDKIRKDRPGRAAAIVACNAPVLASSGTKTVAEPQKVLFVDAFQHHSRRLLDNFVLQGRDAQRPQFAIPFGNVRPLRGLGPVGTAKDPAVQIVDPTFKSCRVILPRLFIHSGGRVFLQIEETGTQKFRSEVMVQIGELLPSIPPCCCTYA